MTALYHLIVTDPLVHPVIVKTGKNTYLVARVVRQAQVEQDVILGRRLEPRDGRFQRRKHAPEMQINHGSERPINCSTLFRGRDLMRDPSHARKQSGRHAPLTGRRGEGTPTRGLLHQGAPPRHPPCGATWQGPRQSRGRFHIPSHCPLLNICRSI